MTTVKVNASSTYDIIIEADILDKLGEYAKPLAKGCRACIVTDTTVDALYAKRAEISLVNEGFDVIKFVIEAGEASKSTQNLVAILEFLAENRLTHSDIVVALGGGVVGDLAGFASAVYLRGIGFIQVPTTLLAMVDSSVGGKTAVNLEAGKNLAGAFHQPSLVLCDYKTLDTLPDEIFSDGCAEIIKYGVINDRPLFDELKKGVRSNIEKFISACVTNKAKIVAQDEFDKGTRQLLNLGHTVGHAIEKCSDLEISHGKAVAIGMCVVTRIAVSLGICPEAHLKELIDLLDASNLPTDCPFSANELAAAASADKKRYGNSINLIVPYAIGDCRPMTVQVSDLAALIQKGL